MALSATFKRSNRTPGLNKVRTDVGRGLVLVVPSAQALHARLRPKAERCGVFRTAERISPPKVLPLHFHILRLMLMLPAGTRVIPLRSQGRNSNGIVIDDVIGRDTV